MCPGSPTEVRAFAGMTQWAERSFSPPSPWLLMNHQPDRHLVRVGRGRAGRLVPAEHVVDRPSRMLGIGEIEPCAGSDCVIRIVRTERDDMVETCRTAQCQPGVHQILGAARKGVFYIRLTHRGRRGPAAGVERVVLFFCFVWL